MTFHSVFNNNLNTTMVPKKKKKKKCAKTKLYHRPKRLIFDKTVPWQITWGRYARVSDFTR